uniref:Uncharacterized protein n=1 Tax=Helicoverpa armigera nucleopolyhedrovirus TaxID=51313 RepID=A0A0E3JAJ4_9ABAC|nr:hypothetical protein ORF-134 [Helicoverpa armigera nucleopolyhedrovirus]AJP07558.1 hypothetical protein ORF-134 [Helicoverpa armigera nucleopolyhedrovirus]
MCTPSSLRTLSLLQVVYHNVRIEKEYMAVLEHIRIALPSGWYYSSVESEIACKNEEINWNQMLQYIKRWKKWCRNDKWFNYGIAYTVFYNFEIIDEEKLNLVTDISLALNKDFLWFCFSDIFKCHDENKPFRKPWYCDIYTDMNTTNNSDYCVTDVNTYRNYITFNELRTCKMCNPYGFII